MNTDFWMPSFSQEEEVSKIPLFMAVKNNNLQMLRRLIRDKVDVNVQAPRGMKTALHLAIEFNFTNVARELMILNIKVYL